MNPRQLLRVGIALAVLIFLWGAFAIFKRQARDAEAGFSAGRIDAERVDSVRIAHPGGDTLVIVRAESSWRARGVSADSAKVVDLFQVLGDTVNAELVSETSASHERLAVDSTRGKRLQVFARESLAADLVSGSRGPDFEGIYVRRATDPVVYLVRGAYPEILDRRLDDWLARRIAAITPDSVASIEITRGRRSYALQRGEEWTLGSGAAADTAAIGYLLDQYVALDASGFASRAEADSADFERPDRRVRLLDREGHELLHLVFDFTPAHFRVRAAKAGTVFTLDHFTAERIAPAESVLAGKPAGK